jgi:Flp pilus assembly protein protease CpaA
MNLAFVLGFLLAAYFDLKERVVPRPILFALGVLALIGRHWSWWVASLLAYFLPPNYSIFLLFFPFVIPFLTKEIDPIPAYIVSVIGFYYRWWGGADAILLLVLSLRYGQAGLIASIIALFVSGIVSMAIKRVSPRRVGWALLKLISFGPEMEGEEIPKESEVPAASFLAAAGLALEILKLLGRLG